MPTGSEGSSGAAGATTRRTRSAFLALSEGRSVARGSPERGSTRSTEERSHRATRKAQLQERAVGGGDSEAHAAGGDGAVAATLDACDLGPERAPQCIGAGAFAGDAGSAQAAREGDSRISECSFRWYFLGPVLGGGVEQVEREHGLALEHGQEAPLDLPPEGLLLSVLLGEYGSVVWWATPRRSRPSPVSAASMAAPLSVKGGARQSALVEGLREAVDEGLGGLVEIPLQVAAERERSSRTPSSWGFCHWPPAVSTGREPWWKSRCQRPWTWATS